MAVRVFDGVDDEIRFSNNPDLTGAFSIFTLIKRTDNTTYHCLLSVHNSTSVGFVTLEIASSVGGNKPLLDISAVGSSVPTTMTVLAADGWVIIGVTKGSGSVLPRFHKYVVSTNTWTHENGANALANAATHSGGTTRLGEYQDIDDFAGKAALDLITAGAALSDAQAEALSTNKNVTDWTGHAITPTRVWRPGDTTPTDLMGAADTATIFGTTVDTLDDPPGWTLVAGGGTDSARREYVVSGAIGRASNW